MAGKKKKEEEKQKPPVVETPPAAEPVPAEQPTVEMALTKDGDRAYVVKESGEVVTLPLETIDSGKAAEYGYRVATQEEALEGKLEEKYGGPLSTLRATGERFLQGATMGTYDAMAIGLGANPERLREEAERAGMAGDIAEGLGVVTTSLASGGGGGLAQLIGRGGLAAAGKTVAQAGLKQVAKSGIKSALKYSPTGFVTQAGRAMEPALARGLAGLAGKTTPGLLARSTAAGVVGAGEAALYGAGEALSEAAHLGDPQLAGELLMAKMGGNAVLGGSAAAAFTLATGAIGRGVAKAANMAQAKRLASESSAEGKAFANSMSKAKAAGELSQEAESRVNVLIEESQDKSLFEKGMEKVRQRKNYVERQRTQDGLARNIQDKMTSLNRMRNKALESYYNIDGKVKGFIEDYKGISAQHKNGMLIHARDKILDLRTRLDTHLGEGRYHEKGSLSLMNDLRTRINEQHLSDLSELAMDPDNAKAAGRAMGILDDVKRQLDNAAVTHSRRQMLRGSKAEQLLTDYANEFRDDLVDPAIWGEKAIGRQQLDNIAWHNWINKSKAKVRYLDESMGYESGEGYTTIKPADWKRIKAAVIDADTPDKAVRTLREFTQADVELIEQLQRSHVGQPKEAQKLVEEYRQLSNDVLSDMDEATRVAEDIGKYEEFLAETTDLPGPVAAAKRIAITGMAAVNQASKLNAMAEATSSAAAKVKAAVKSTIDTGKAAAKAAKEGVDITARGTKEVVPFVPVVGEEHYEGLKGKYDKAIKIDKQHQNNMMILRDRLSSVTQNTVDVAPNTTMAFAQAGLRGSEFMRSKRPDPPIRPSDVTAHLDTRQRVSDSQMAKYLRYREGLDPINAMEKLAKGHISREGAETLRTVYPQMFAMVKQEVGEQLVAAKEPLPLRNLMHLSILLDTPLHPSFEPRYVATVQKMHAEHRAERQRPQPKQAPDMAKNYASRSHQLA